MLALAAISGALVLAGAAGAGGSFERVVGVGAGGAWTQVRLVPRSDAALAGPSVPVPREGFVRVYPFVGSLPAIPGRYYPGPHVLCLSWHEPPAGCVRLAAAGARLLAPFARLPRRTAAPTVVTSVRFRTLLLRYADGNVFAALELALERPARPAASAPAYGVRLSVTWRGPERAAMPSTLLLAPAGVYVRRAIFPLPHGVWCFLAGNLPARLAGASLIEATARHC